MELENNLFETYQLRSLLGLGGMGEAWLAIRLMPRSEVVIKLIPARNLSHESDNDFITTAQAVARLQHPNILPLIDYGRVEGYFYLVTPYKAKGSLQQLLQTETLPPFQAFEIAGQTLAGLNYAHQQGIIHGNLKPSNILLNNNGRWLVADFGVIEIESKVAGSTPDENFFADSPYLAPEQHQGQTSYRSDLYAVGVLLYHMLTGREPWNNPPNDAPDLGESLRLPHPLVPPPLEPLLKQALQKQPEKRFGSVDEMGNALDKAIGRLHAPTVQPQTKNGDTPAPPVSITTLPLPSENGAPNQIAATLPRPDLENNLAQTTAHSFQPSPLPDGIHTKPYSPIQEINQPPTWSQADSTQFSPFLTQVSSRSARLRQDSGLTSLNPENAITTPYSFSSLLSSLDALELEESSEFVYDEVGTGRPKNEKGWYFPAGLGLLFLLLFAVGLAVLVVILSL